METIFKRSTSSIAEKYKPKSRTLAKKEEFQQYAKHKWDIKLVDVPRIEG